MNLKDLPKIELHLHLDCSLSYQVVSRINPEITFEQYQQEFIAPPKCSDLLEYLERAPKAINLMQTADQLEWVVDDFFQQIMDDHIIYVELRYAPLEHTRQGLKSFEVVDLVEKATQRAIHKYNVEAGILLCALRSYSESKSLETVHLVNRFKGTKVAGFDIAGDEAGYPIKAHIPAFNYARKKGIPCTAHAGEALGPDSVRETLNHFQPKRIGHGARSIEDLDLVQYLKEKNIHLELCPTSNVQTNVCNAYQDHPISKFYDSGIHLSVNTDSRTISNITLTDEYQRLHKHFGWEENHFFKCNLMAIEAAFTDDTTKSRLKDRLIVGYK